MARKQPFLRQVRQEVGLSAVQVAEYMGVDRVTVSRWETGENKVSIWGALKLARLFGCSMETLVDESAFARWRMTRACR